MKRGFLNKPNAFAKASTGYDSNIVKSQTPLVINLADQSKEVGGLKRATVDVSNCKAHEYQFRENNGARLDYPDDAWLASTQPSQPMDATLADVPDGWAECFITGRAKRAIVSVPGFPEALPRTDPSRPKPYTIVESTGKGMGMFAARDIEWGELIVAERPMLVIPVAFPYEGAAVTPANFTTDHIQQLHLNQTEKVMEMLFSRMPKENQEAYKKLANCHKEDGSGPLYGIVRTNGFGLEDYCKIEKPGHPERYSGIFKDLSRINHSCRPNAERDWDSPTFSLQLRASKPIKKDEEITITYISDVTDPTKERQRQLGSYGFTCTCEACSNPKLSDPKSKEIKELLKPAMFLFDPMAMDWVNPATGVGIGMDMPSGMPGMTPMGMGSSKGKKSQTGAFDVATNLVNSIVEPALRGLKLMEEEGLYGNPYGELLGRVANGYEMMGQSSKEKNREAKAWAEKYERYQKYFESARNAKQREEKEQEEKSKRNEGGWHEDKQLAEMMNEMMKKMNA